MNIKHFILLFTRTVQEDTMLSTQEERDGLFIEILQNMHGDVENAAFLYGFDDIETGEGYYGVQYYVMDKEPKNTLLGFGMMATDREMSHVLVLTMFPIPIYSIIIPSLF